MINNNNANDLIGADVRGSDDAKIGTVGQVYLDAESESPSWVTIKTGLFGTGESFAPLSDANFDGGVVRVPYAKDFVKDAPRIADDGALSEQEEDSLYRYYGNGGASTGATDGASPDVVGGVASGGYDRDTRTDVDAPRGAGHDTSGPNTDDAMTRSEERLRVGTDRVETGRARLRKHIVSEQQSVTVPVSHEEVTLDREPITEANIGDATSGGDLTEEEHEVVLTGERVVTDKETVPVERVRLGKESVTENRQVSDEVRHEEIEVVDDTANRADRDGV